MARQHDIFKSLMLRRKTFLMIGNEAGDTLVEVTIGLTILGVVLLGATAIASTAFKLGQTAQNRTQISEVAQEQMEALRSYRDNSTWAAFENGINTMPSTGFHMVLSFGASTQWVPAANSLTAAAGTSLTVPGATMKITTATANALRGCGYDFVLAYSFPQPGGSLIDTNRIQTRLANLQYQGALAQCP